MGLNSILAVLFGNKSQRDAEKFRRYVEYVQAELPEIEKLSNDELRAKTLDLKYFIQSVVADLEEKIETLKKDIENIDISEREKIWKEIGELEKIIAARYELALDVSLPVAFAIVVDTARRFAQNEEIVVTAGDFDRELAKTMDFVSINGDKAIYKNRWMAGGNEIVWDMVHYEEQIYGGVVLHKIQEARTGKDEIVKYVTVESDTERKKRLLGYIAEMATGEGKTLVATLPVFLNALTGNGVHVVTVNDYLSKRDSEWMGPLYMFHGLTVDCIDKHQPNTESRRKAYAADITFGTNNEFGFDYLRDNMAVHSGDLVQRTGYLGHNYAIVDEADSILIDDARTPLIISGPTPKGEDQLFDEFRPRVEIIVKAQRELCTKLLAEARAKMASDDKKVQEEGSLLLFRSYKGLPKSKPLIKFLSEPGVKASMLKTEDFYMAEQMRNMHLVTDDLYFTIDEKNNSIELTDKGIDLLTGKSDDPLFFILPDIGTQMAELENANLSDHEKAEKKDELTQNYSIKSERVHTINQLLKAYALFEKDDQYVVMDNKVLIVDEQTGRIMDGRRYSDGLHQAIEAKERVKVEAATQTFATITLQNYFRMYYKLAGMTGTAETEAGELWDIYKLDVVVIPTHKPIARNDMNDRIYKTKREKYQAVIQEIEELTSKSRPVLVGTTSVEISELLSKMLHLRKIKHNILNAKLHQKEAEIVALAGQSGTVTIATNMAGRGTDIKLTPEVREAGGLAIIGTERHESRRVDRQLRGRSGRQGDPGSSVFFVSLEDNLMRLFASDRIAKWMDRMGFKEGEVLEHSMLNKSVERAQKKVEENNFGIRKRLLEYDDVMNKQREVVYERRRHALMGERIDIDILNMLYEVSIAVVEQYYDSPDYDYDDLKIELLRIMAVEAPFEERAFKSERMQNLSEQIYEKAIQSFKVKMDRLAEIANPVIKNVYETQGDKYQNILVPVSDGKRIYNISCDLKEAYDTGAKGVIKSFEKSILLHTIDEQWKEHLREMDDLRQSVQNASYEQKDPLLIYKLESFNLFKTMVDTINKKAVAILMRAQIPVRQAEDVRQAAPESKTDYSRYRTEKSELPGQNPNPQRGGQIPPQGEKPKPMPIRVDKKPGRNDPCYCGSGKKYKNCHGRLEE